ncbi:MAG: acyl-CoA dehydrogenase family protein [Mycobacteriaceae bacterium]
MYIPIPMSEEHAAMSSTVRQLLERHVDVADVRTVLDIGRDGLAKTEVWQRAASIGLPGITIPEEFGGMGGGALETFIAFRDWGRAVHPSPLLSSVGMAAPAVLHAGHAEAKEQYLPPLAEGTKLGAVAIFEDGGGWDPNTVRTTATHVSGASYRLTGHKQFVLDLPSADDLFVVSRADFGLALFVVSPNAEGLTEEPLTSLDLTRSFSNVLLEDVEATLVSSHSDSTAALTDALRITALCAVADSVGGAEAVLDMAVSYAKVREQFGRPIGSFQAIKHKLAELAVTVEGMVSTGWAAAQALASGRADADIDLLVAKVVCGKAYFDVARANIQVHGGIGFTWEHPAHLYFRRALSNEKLLGDPDSDRADLYHRLVTRAAGSTVSDVAR